ncbi:MAG: fibronectin type III domain-containing protein [Clostridia bacterium]|nr:fibronectin type III domain-containing protein [Clostridia bacterium]
MKQIARQSAAILLAVLMLLTVLPLGSFAADTPPETATVKCGACGTSVTVKTTKAATCTADGLMSAACPNCGRTVTKTITKLGHAVKRDDKGKVIYTETTPASCGVEGVKSAYCERCGIEMIEYRQTSAALDHSWVKNVNDQYLKNEAYCQAPKTYFLSCENCGMSAKDFNGTIDGGNTFVPAGSNKDPNRHINEIPDPAAPVVEASCTATGWSGGTKCADCGATIKETAVTEKKNHEAKEGKEATCHSLAVCKFCGGTFGVLNPENHENVVADNAVAATCDKAGLTAGSHCAACGLVIIEQKEVTKLAEDGKHTFGAWEFPKGYDCEVGGIITRTCTVCQTVEERTVRAGDHIEVEDPAVPATCTESGLTAGSHCEYCKLPLKSQDTVPALNHEFKGAAIDNKDGTHSFKCTRCDAVSAPETCVDEDLNCVCDVCGAQLAHKFTTYVSNQDATCQKDGTKTAVCDVCKKAKDTVEDVDSHLTGAHDFEYKDLDDATCLLNAHRVGTCKRCGKEVTTEIEGSALGHDVSDWIYAPTYNCEQGGLRYKECKRCGALQDEETVAPTAHTPVADPAVPVTCTTDGLTAGAHCSVCKAILTPQEVIPHEGHKAAGDDAFKTVKDPTCTEEGSKEAVCVKCGETFAAPIPALGHDLGDAYVVAPTCTANGYTGRNCTRCDYVEKTNIVKKTGHTLKQGLRPAQWGKNGKIVTVCTVCGERNTTVIPKIKSIKLSETTYVKDGKAKTPTVTVTDAKGKALKKGRDFTVTYPKGRKNLGTYTVTINFIGNYTGTKTRTFTITIGKVQGVKAVANQTAVALSWSKVKYATQYVVYYATSADGKYKKLVITTDLKYTVTKLNPGTVYYFKVKAVRTDKNGTYIGAASEALKVKTKKAA